MYAVPQQWGNYFVIVNYKQIIINKSTYVKHTVEEVVAAVVSTVSYATTKK